MPHISMEAETETTFKDVLPAIFLADIVRGITHFAQDTKYHRDNSCGSKDQTVSEKFAMNPVDTKAEIERKKKALQTCYIDRLMYNSIYIHVLHRQEVRHLQELKEVEKLWQDYNPGWRIDVQVGYDDNSGEPNIVAIYYEHGKNMLDEEIYMKSGYGGEIECERKEYKLSVRRSPFLIARYYKTQTFEKELPWSTKQRNSI
jgi:hypothetical protein